VPLFGGGIAGGDVKAFQRAAYLPLPISTGSCSPDEPYEMDLLLVSITISANAVYVVDDDLRR
jgi:hypothetical protein